MASILRQLTSTLRSKTLGNLFNHNSIRNVTYYEFTGFKTIAPVLNTVRFKSTEKAVDSRRKEIFYGLLFCLLTELLI